MNTKGQAALEYLMTYGWALVIIVVVAGLLFFLMSSPTGGVTCNSSDPAKFPVSRYNIASGAGPQDIVIQNGSGGTITFTAATDDGSLANATYVPAAGTSSVYGGASITISNVCGAGTAPCVAGTAYTGSSTLTYTDQFGYAGKTVTIRCQGTIR